MGYFEEQTGRYFQRVKLLTLDIYFVTAILQSCLGSVQTVNASLFIAITGQARRNRDGWGGLHSPNNSQIFVP